MVYSCVLTYRKTDIFIKNIIIIMIIINIYIIIMRSNNVTKLCLLLIKQNKLYPQIYLKTLKTLLKRKNLQIFFLLKKVCSKILKKNLDFG